MGIMPLADTLSGVRVPSPTMDLSPTAIEFGKIFVPVWLASRYEHGNWGPLQIESLPSVQLHPASVVFHYGQAIFEGLKAYKWKDGSIHLFRPHENAARFRQSAERMAMPPVDEENFVEGIRRLVDLQREWVPDAPGSLYIRPTMIATEACIGVRTANEFLFFVITLPSGAYFPQTAHVKGAGSVKVFVTESVGRAAHGGTGNVKAAANYAVTLKVIAEAKHKGCSQVLFLDACDHRNLEEMGGMNIFYVRQGKLVTPRVNDTILPGITRDSILRLAPKLGYDTTEADTTVADLVAGIKSGDITEAFACGTAAVVVGIQSLLFESGEEISLGAASGPVTSNLYEHLVGIQYGSRTDPFEWVTAV